MLNYPLRAAPPAEAGVQLGDSNNDAYSSVTTTFPTGPRPSPGKEAGWDAAFVSGLDTALHTFAVRSEEHTFELQSLMRISYAVFCLKKKNTIYHFIQHPSLQTTEYAH